MVARFVKDSTPANRLSLDRMEQLLVSRAGCPIPASVLQNNNEVFVRLRNPADVERDKVIFEAKDGPNNTWFSRLGG